MIPETYFIDDKGIFFVEKPYRDVEYNYLVKFDSFTKSNDFEVFCERLRKEGQAQQSAKIRSALGI